MHTEHDSDALAAALRNAIREGLLSSPALRTLLVELARETLALDDGLHQRTIEPEPPAPEVLPAADAVTRSPETDRDQAPEPPLVQVPLRLGDVTLPVRVAGTEAQRIAVQTQLEHARAPRERPVETPIDLALIAIRSRLKAESCRFFIDRRAGASDPTFDRELSRKVAEFVARGKGIESCFLWVFWKDARQPSDEQLRIIADLYDALADGALLCASAIAPDSILSDEEIEHAFACLAEASSALRVALDWTWLSTPDIDQDQAHHWLRQQTAFRRVYVERHMTLDDPASPYRAAALRGEIASISEGVELRRAASKQIDSTAHKARYHAQKLAWAEPHETHDATKLLESIERLATLGVSASDRRITRIRNLLSGVPLSQPLESHHLLREPPRPQSREQALTPAREWSERVAELRDILHGQHIVIIGGEPRQDAIARIYDAFGLADVEWVPLTEHGTGTPMIAPIQRESTRLVLVLIKLCGHLHVDEARSSAAATNTPCVLLPAGYNPEQIAEETLQQVGKRLRGE